MGLDDDADCVEHDWVLTGLRLSLADGLVTTETCARCRAVRHVTDPARTDKRRQPLEPTRRLLGED